MKRLYPYFLTLIFCFGLSMAKAQDSTKTAPEEKKVAEEKKVTQKKHSHYRKTSRYGKTVRRETRLLLPS